MGFLLFLEGAHSFAQKSRKKLNPTIQDLSRAAVVTGHK
jgi:hypothetical protein